MKLSKVLQYLLLFSIVSLLLLGVFYWDYNREKVIYYKDYTQQWGVPVGIHPISHTEQKNRVNSYKFTYKYYRVQRVCYVNSHDLLAEHIGLDDTERPSELRITYHENGNVDSHTICGLNNDTLYVKSYSADMKVARFRYEHKSHAGVRSASMLPFTGSMDNGLANDSIINRYLITYNADGYVTQIRFAGVDDMVIADNNGIAGIRFNIDEKGRIIEERYLNLIGEVKALKSGVAIHTKEFNGDDDPIRYRALTQEREASGDAGLGVPVWRNVVDKWGNVTIQRYESLNGDLLLSKDLRIAGIKSEIVGGLVVSRSYFGLDGNACCDSVKMVAGYSMEYDDKGCLKSLSYYDMDKNPTVAASGESGFDVVKDGLGELEYRMISVEPEVDSVAIAQDSIQTIPLDSIVEIPLDSVAVIPVDSVVEVDMEQDSLLL